MTDLFEEQLYGIRQEGGHEDPPLDGLCPGTGATHARLLQFRDFVFHHLHSFRRHQFARPGDRGRRRRLDRHRLADRLPHLRRVRAGDGPDRVVLSDRRRALSLELHSREPLYRLADGVAQSARPDHSSRRDQCRHVGIFFRRDRTLVPCDQRRYDRRGGVSQSDHLHGADHRPPGADQSLRHQA